MIDEGDIIQPYGNLNEDPSGDNHSKCTSGYYLGLSVSPTSVGWAVTDSDYNILKYRRRSTWGVHLFDRANTAEERRQYRISRRRIDRRRYRIQLLQELFGGAIDLPFFESLNNSGLVQDDDSVTDLSSFYDKRRFPTMYHLRKHLMSSTDYNDIRLIYLACHHIIKHRGHFLFESRDVGDIPSLNDSILMMLNDIDGYGVHMCITDPDQFVEILSNDSLSVTERKRSLRKSLICKGEGRSNSFHGAVCDLLSGGKVDLSKMFSDDTFSNESISFFEPYSEQRMSELETVLPRNQFGLLRSIKNVYDCSILSKITSGFGSISDYKVSQYDAHKADLRQLKSAIREYIPDKYHDIFKSKSIKGNYCSYVGVCGDSKPDKCCSHDEFCKYLESQFRDSAIGDDPQYSEMISRIRGRRFLKKLSSRENSIIPNSIHHRELSMILDNAAEHHPFLLEEDGNGLSVKDRVLKLHTFRIPYFVDPLGRSSEASWVVRRSDERITPWNFESVIDLGATAEIFIDKCVGECSYIRGEKVLPKDSILYSRFRLYDRLNHVRVDGKSLSFDVKHYLINALFKGCDSPIGPDILLSHLYAIGVLELEGQHKVTGLTEGIHSILYSENVLRRIIGESMKDIPVLEDIVLIIVAFDDSILISDMLRNKYGRILSEQQIQSLSKLGFSGWSNISRRFLTGLYEVETGTKRPMNIMEMLEYTPLTFEEILKKYPFRKQADSPESDIVGYGDLDRYHLLPSEKRAAWRAVSVVRDIASSLGGMPKKVFLESIHNDRYRHQDDVRNRYDRLLESYIRNEESDQWLGSIRSCGPKGFRSRNVYLYHAQLGRCMYCGRHLPFDSIHDPDIVNRDHIFPLSKYRDDKVQDNIVLCCRSCNESKGDTYPVRRNVQVRMSNLWDELRSKGYMSVEKYNRLTRSDALTNEECSNSVSGWIVEDNRVTRALRDLFARMFGDMVGVSNIDSDIISELRQYLGIIRNRSVNDLYRAKDAYLSVVAGNVHLAKYTDDPSKILWVVGRGNLGRPYSGMVSSVSGIVWGPEHEGTVRKHLRRDDILFTRFPYVQNGPLFDDTLHKAGDCLYNKKKDLPSNRFGGYIKERGACYSLIESYVGDTIMRSLEVLERHSLHLLDDPIALQKHFSEKRGTVVHIIIPVIRMHSMIDWNGFPLHISGRMNQFIMYYPALQMLLPDDLHAYCRKVRGFAEDNVSDPEFHGIDKGANIRLFDHILDKCESEPYVSMTSALRKNLHVVRNDFVRSDVAVQARVLNEILNSFRCDASSTSLKAIGGVGSTGRIILNSRLPTDSKGIYLVNQSPSGLNENRIRLDRGDI